MIIMNIVYEKQFRRSFGQIVDYIAADKPTAARNFKKEMKNRFERIMDNPRMYRASVYFEDVNYRDMVYQGYTTIYKIDKNTIRVLDIFKWMDKY